MAEAEKVVAPFTRFLQEHRNGRLQSELADAVNELVEAIVEHGKPGSLTLTLKMKPATKGLGNSLLVTDEVKVKKPMGERGESLFFADDHSNLSRRDPRQPEIPGLTDVSAPAEDAQKAKEA
jgi:hypothetical protein